MLKNVLLLQLCVSWVIPYFFVTTFRTFLTLGTFDHRILYQSLLSISSS